MRCSSESNKPRTVDKCPPLFHCRIILLVLLGQITLTLCVCSGKEAMLLMQSLNKLDSPEQKLEAIIKKHAELVRKVDPGEG